MITPSLAEQRELESWVEATLRRAHERATGRTPTAEELAPLVRRELNALAPHVSPEFLAGLAVPAEPPAAPPAPELVSTWMTEAQHAEAAASLWYAKLHGIASIPMALSWYITYQQAERLAPPVAQCIAEFLRVRRAGGARPHTLSLYRARLESLSAHFGARIPHTLRPPEMLHYLETFPTPMGRRSHWETLHSFWNWLVSVGYARENLVASALQRPYVQTRPGPIFTVPETATILAHVKHTDQVLFWTLSLFAGLSRNELELWQRAEDPWRAIDMRCRLITLTPPVAVAPRTIRMQPNLAAWLHWIRPRGVPFYPANHYDKYRITRALALGHRYKNAAEAEAGKHGRRVEGRAAVGMARRSFISYRLALSGASFAEVADEVVRHEVHLKTRFYRKTTPEEAEKYFRLGPRAV
jgi:hypothetical protein